MSRHVNTVKSLAVLGLAIAALGATVSALAGWSAPATLGSSSLYFMYANNVSVAASAHPLAESVAVWVEPSTMDIRYAVQRGGTWTKAKTLYSSNANASETVTDPQVVIDATGTATAVWGSTKQGPMKYCSYGLIVYRCPEIISYAKSATLAPGAASWVKTTVSAKGFSVLDAQVGIDLSGNAVALWSYRPTRTAGVVLQSASRPAGGVWEAPVTIPASSGGAQPRLAVGQGGDVLAAWVQRTTGPSPSSELVASYRPSGAAGWPAVPELVTSQAGPIGYLRAAVSGSGRTAVVWNDASQVAWAHRTAGIWSVPETLSGSGTGPDVAALGADTLLISWLQLGTAPDGGNVVEARTVAPDLSMSPASWPVGTNVPPSVAASGDGSLGLVAWLDETDYNVYAARLIPAVGWADPVVLSTGASQFSAVWGMGVSVAAGPAQTATAAWLSVAGPYAQIRILGSSFRP